MPSDVTDRATRKNEQTSRSITRRKWMQVAGATGVTALAGCPGNGDGSGGDGGDGGDGGATTGNSDQITTIELWRWPHSTDPSNTGEDQIVEAFNEGPGAEQNIRVEQVKNPYGDYYQALRTSIGGEDAPAIAWTHPEQLYDYAGQSRSEIAENAPFAFLDDYMTDDYRNQFFDQAWDWQESRFKGIVGVPFIASVRPGLMYVNVDAWNEAGLGDLPEGSWSYEEYLNAVEQLHGTEVNGRQVNGAGVATADAVSNTEWTNYLNALSRTAGNLTEAGYLNTDDEYVLTLAQDAVVESWNNLIGTPIENGWTNNPGAYEYAELQEPFAAGQIGLLHHSTFSRVAFSEQADFEFDIVPYPTKNGEENYLLHEAYNWEVMFSAYREDLGGNPDAAWEYIKFRNNAENQYEWFNLSSQCIPNRAAYELMQEEGVSDFVEESRGLELMDRVATAAGQYEMLRETRLERFPNMQQTESGSLQNSVPTSLGSGRVHDAVGGALQQLAQSGNANPQEEITAAEETWGELIADADDLAVDESSIGYNQPEPQDAPVEN